MLWIECLEQRHRTLCFSGLCIYDSRESQSPSTHMLSKRILYVSRSLSPIRGPSRHACCFAIKSIKDQNSEARISAFRVIDVGFVDWNIIARFIGWTIHTKASLNSTKERGLLQVTRSASCSVSDLRSLTDFRSRAVQGSKQTAHYETS